MYNINYGKNEQLLNQCGVLKDYSIFVKYVRYYFEEQNYEDLELAINKAIDRCIEENILSEFLRNNRDEVVKVTQLDYTFDRQIELEREEAKQEGFDNGYKSRQSEVDNLNATIADKEAAIADKDAEIANNKARIAQLEQIIANQTKS